MERLKTRFDVHHTSLEHFSAVPLLEKNIRTWHFVICDWPLTLRITSSKTQADTQQQPASLMVLKCFRVRSSSNICYLMGGFHSESLIVPWACIYFQHTGPSGNPTLTPALLKQCSSLGATRLQCFTPTQFKSVSESTVCALCRARCSITAKASFAEVITIFLRDGFVISVHGILWDLIPTSIPYYTNQTKCQRSNCAL